MLAGVLAVQWSEAEASMLDAGVTAPLFSMGARPALSWVYTRLRSGADTDEDKAALAAWQDPDLTLDDVAKWDEEQEREEQARRRRLAEMGR
jgi:hypothetical protein